MKWILALLISILSVLFFNNQQVYAAKKFVPKKSAVVKTGSTTTSGKIPAVVRYRGDKKAILLSFSHFKGLKSVSYSFTYTTNGMSQGAGGTVTAANNPTSNRELLFGTCSTSVCSYHSNLKNATLTLRATFSNGKVVSKTYRIKTSR